jgi:hypothetical protein
MLKNSIPFELISEIVIIYCENNMKWVSDDNKNIYINNNFNRSITREYISGSLFLLIFINSR